jgi:hypothetical protein
MIIANNIFEQVVIMSLDKGKKTADDIMGE